MREDRTGGVSVRPAAGRDDMRRFVEFPRVIYRHDPAWAAPPKAALIHRLDPARNPFYATARRELFLAWRGDELVGTVAAIMDDARNLRSGTSEGYFGFFETIDDPAVSKALLDAATGWLVRVGATVVRGPTNGSGADETGLLVDGFDTRPGLWQGHHRPYYRLHLEGHGLVKADDLLAYELTRDDVGDDVGQVLRFLAGPAGRARASAVVLRSPSNASWDHDLAVVYELYLRSHRSVPGHAGPSFDQFASTARRLRPVTDLDLTVLAEVAGEVVGFAIAVPDVSEVLARRGGFLRLWASGRLVHRVPPVSTVSIKLLGVAPEHRGRGVGALLCDELGRRMSAKGYHRCEMSLVSEKNTGMTTVLEGAGARAYRRYRVYEARLPLQT